MNAPKLWLQKFVDLSGISDKAFAKKMTFAGNKVEAIHKIDGETVFEFEVTSNRPDTLSIIGLAREAAAILSRKFTPPPIPEVKKLKSSPVKLIVSNPKLLPTFSIVEIDNITVKPSSKNIQRLLTLAGIRPINNIVDITNFLLWEHAQLMHTFDADKIKGNLSLRLAKPGEVITLLNHKTYKLLGKEIIIEDNEKIVDLPGIMGALNTEISSSTTKVLLLLGIDDPIHVRRASKTLKVRSDSVTRSEKKLDLTQTELVAKRVIQFLKKEAGGKPVTKLVTSHSHWKPPIIKLTEDKVRAWIGQPIPQVNIDAYLASVGITKTKLGYQPPPWRRDLLTPVDLIEEVARLHGYNRLPLTLPTGTIPIHQTALTRNYSRTIKNIVAGLGYTETYSSTLIGKDSITTLGLNPKTHLKVLHPMSKDYQYMRTTILESLIPLLKKNQSPKTINLFELGTVFYKTKSKTKLPEQISQLGLLTNLNFPKLKGQLEALANSLNLKLEFKPAQKPYSGLHPYNQAEIWLKTKTVGYIGQLPTQKIWAATLNVNSLSTQANSDYQYPQISPYSPIIEDLTFTLKSNSYLGPIIDTIKSMNKLVQSVNLTKVYQKNHTFNITYQSHTKPLSDKLVAPIRKKIVSRLNQKFRAKLVGKL